MDERKNFYITARDGSKTYFLAGPYLTIDEASEKVKIAKKIACDFSKNKSAGRAHFMSYGVSKWKAEEQGPLSALGEI